MLSVLWLNIEGAGRRRVRRQAMVFDHAHETCCDRCVPCEPEDRILEVADFRDAVEPFEDRRNHLHESYTDIRLFPY